MRARAQNHRAGAGRGSSARAGLSLTAKFFQLGPLLCETPVGSFENHVEQLKSCHLKDHVKTWHGPGEGEIERMALEKITDAGDIVKRRKGGEGSGEGGREREEEGKFRCFMHDHR